MDTAILQEGLSEMDSRHTDELLFTPNNMLSIRPMRILYSDIPPMPFNSDGMETVSDCFHRLISKSDRIEIAAGYVSKAALDELDELVDEYHIRKITLIMGMYFIEGMPENIYHTALKIDEKWRKSGIGEIRLATAFKFHGKIYEFFYQDEYIASILGSANLGVIRPDASSRRQYEIAVEYNDPKAMADTQYKYIFAPLKDPSCSVNITEIKDRITLVRQPNISLKENDTVSEVPLTNINIYKNHSTDISFVLPLKVPDYKDRFMDDGRHYTKSNINVCYAAPRNPRKNRDWYEVQLTVAKEITKLPGYPEKNAPFFVVTDDGYMFKAHTTSDGNKQFSAVGDELIMGRWVKGRLAAAGLVMPQNDTGKDTNRDGMITREMLDEYGCDCIRITKTTQKALDENNNMLDIWLISLEKAGVEW